MAVIRIVVIVVEKSINNGQGSRGESTVPFTNTLVNLDKGVINILLARRMGKPTREKTGPWTVIMFGTLFP